MSSTAKLYIHLTIAIGISLLVGQVISWQSADLFRFLCYLVLAICSSKLKVALPGVTSTMSVLFFFMLFGVVELSLPEVLVMGCAAAAFQPFWDTRRRPRLHQVLFNIASMANAIAVTSAVYHSEFLHKPHLETALMLMMAAVVFFIANTFPVAAAISLTEQRSLMRIWKDTYVWSFPYYLLGAALAGVGSAITRYVGWQTSLMLLPLVYLVYRAYHLYLGRMEDGRKHAEEMAALHLRTIEALALAIDAKDQTTHEHLQRVQVYAVEIGKELELEESELNALRAASLLHDIGKLAVPEHIISKPGKLTREEFEKMKIHPVVGAEILERVRFPYPVTPIVRSHHEKWDGSGYPDGLKGEQIPLGARILSAVDTLDALASDRQYRRALPLDEAMGRIAAESGIAFDPRIVGILQRRYIELEQMAQSFTIDRAKLSTDLVIERGLKPDAGFETSAALTTQPAYEKKGDFLTSIAAARQEVQSLFELAQDLGNSLSLNETLSLLAIRLKRMIPYDSLAIYSRHGDILKAEYVSGENYRLFSTLEIPVGQGLSGWVAENHKPILNGNPSVEPGYLNDETKFTTMRSALSAPLIGVSGEVSVLTLYRTEKDAFTKDNLRILLAIGAKVALSIENAFKYQQAESSAATDYLTGLPNARSLFLHLDSELARCRRVQTPLAVLVCDLNGFKQINDRFGHLEGNRLLHAVAGKLKDSCRDYDYVARMGGDEFVLVLPGVALEQVQATSFRLQAITNDAGREICNTDDLGVSIGHAMYPDDGIDADQLLSEADRRMYIAKHLEKQETRADAPAAGFEFDPMAAAS